MESRLADYRKYCSIMTLQFYGFSELPPSVGRGHSEIRISHLEFGLSSEFRIRDISQSIGDEVEGEDREENGEARKN